MPRTPASSLVGMVFLLLLAVTAGAQDKRLTVEAAVDLKEVRSPAIGPRGEWAAYELRVPREADEEPGGYHTEIWVMPIDEPGKARRFTPRRVNSRAPAWAPDGSGLAFLSTRPGVHEKEQVYFAPLDGGEASALTKHEASIGSFAFSPDGTRIAFVARDAKSKEQRDREELGLDWEIYGVVENFDRLWVLDIASGKTTKVYEGDLNAGSFVWTPDGATLVFHGAPGPDPDSTMMYSKLYRVPAGGGEPKVLYETEGKLGDLEVSPDGKTLAYLGAVDIYDALAQNVFVGSIDGGAVRRVTEGFEEPATRPHVDSSFLLAASVNELTWIDDGSLLVGVTNRTHSAVDLLDVESGKIRELVEGGTIRSLDLHRASGTFLAAANSPRYPSELKVGSLETGELRRLTTSNPNLAGYTLGKRKVIAWLAEDGKRIEGLLTYPPDYEAGKKYPLITNPHGGPEGADRDGWDWIAQIFAARGYVVLQPNYRGSAGRGVAWAKGDHHDLGGKEFTDVLSGIDKLIEDGLVDPERVGIGGWSYGGYFTALGATHHSHRFKAAVMGAGISNWISFLGTTDIPHENYLVHWERWLEGNDLLFWERSPISGIEKANTPTLILHGAGDTRVPPSQAIEMYRALKDHGVETELVIYPRSGHGVSERAHRIDLFTRELDWFDRFLK